MYLKPDGSQYRFGEKQTNPEIGKLLEQLAEKGAESFYTGKTARQMVDLINARGGCFVLEDFTEYRPKYRHVLHTSYHGTDVVSFGPPSGGCAVLEMLNILETRDVRKTGQNTAACACHARLDYAHT